jgi:serine/threonine protein phosphatase 1
MAGLKVFKSLWEKTRGAEASVPDDLRLYVVGDIHGRADLLKMMLDLIDADLRTRPIKKTAELYIGDYLDRGPNASEVIELLSAAPPVAQQRICLMGNHEQIFLDFLRDPSVISSWMGLGGLETLSSYGLRPKLSLQPAEIKSIHSGLLACLPHSHAQFIKQLRPSYSVGGYFFAHAGVRPGVRLEDQMPDDLLWIREPFLSSTKNFGAMVVHGHTPLTEPLILPNRICIDTGAYVTGVLTCLVLEGQEQRFLTASHKRKPVAKSP